MTNSKKRGIFKPQLGLSLALAGFGLLACKSEEKPTQNQAAQAAKVSESSSKEPKAKNEPKTLSADFFGKTVAMPGPLATLKFGIGEAELKALYPDGELRDGYMSLDSKDLEGVRYGISLDRDSQKVTYATMNVPKAAAEMLVSAWGPGIAGTDDVLKKPLVYWFNPAAKLRVMQSEGFGDDLKLEFADYLPMTTLLPEASASGNVLGKPVIGRTIEQLRGDFGPLLTERSAAQAAADSAEVEKFAGLKTGTMSSNANAKIDLPPTEWGKYFTDVWLTWDKKGLVSGYRTILDYSPTPTAKDEMLSEFKKRWGEPKIKHNILKKPVMVFGTTPTISVKDDEITHGWEIAVPADKYLK